MLENKLKTKLYIIFAKLMIMKMSKIAKYFKNSSKMTIILVFSTYILQINKIK